MERFKGITEQIEGLKNFGALTLDDKQSLLKNLRCLKLFTAAHASAKMKKNLQFSKYETYILYMSPASMGFQALGRKGTLCPFATAGCKAACLNTAGRGRFNSVAQARLRKALYYIVARSEFVAHLFNEIGALEIKAKKRRKKLVVRINGTTDIMLDTLQHGVTNIFETYPNVQFYDYTKNMGYALRARQYPNYSITYSMGDYNSPNWRLALMQGLNVAMVFDQVPTEWQGTEVIDGDLHDLRFLDQRGGPTSGLIVGLSAKGKAKNDTSGFVLKIKTCESWAA